MEFVRRPEGVVAIADQRLDAHTALSMIYEAAETDRVAIAVAKELLPEEFFRLSSGVAGEILQKFSNYRARLSIYGDFSGYTSEPLKAFIRECNRGNTVSFEADRDAAVERLMR